MAVEGEPLQEALREVPKKWYENTFTGIVAGHAINATNLYLYLQIKDYADLINDHPYMSASVGGILYLISAIIDSDSTHKAFQALDRARGEGLIFQAGESNPLLKHIKTAEEYKKNKTRLIKDGAITTLCTFLPIFATGFATGKTLASFSNRRLAKRYNRAAEIAQSQK